MRYLLAIVCPPLAMLLCGKPFQFALCIILCFTILGWIPAAIWAVAVVADHKAEKRSKHVVAAIAENAFQVRTFGLPPKPTDRRRRSPDEFYTKVVGVTFTNHDGICRQQLIPHLREGQQLWLIREPRNPHDPNAVMVCAQIGPSKEQHQIGYLSSELAEKLVKSLDAGVDLHAQVLEITGGEDDKSYGVNITLIRPQQTPIRTPALAHPSGTEEIHRKSTSVGQFGCGIAALFFWFIVAGFALQYFRSGGNVDQRTVNAGIF